MVPEVSLLTRPLADGQRGFGRLKRLRFKAFRYEHFGVLPLLSDMVGIMAAAVAAGAVYDVLLQREINVQQYLVIGLALAASFAPLAKIAKLYSLRSLLAAHHLKQVFMPWALSGLVLTALLFASRLVDIVPRGLVMSILLTAIVLVAALRVGVASYVRMALANGWLRTVKIILLGSPLSVCRNREMLTSLGFAVMEEVEVNKTVRPSEFDAIVRQVRTSDVDEIHIAIDDDRAEVVARLVEQLRAVPITIRWIPTPELAGFLTQPVSPLAARPSYKVHRPPLSQAERLVKRSFDVAVASLVLVLLAPAFVVLAVLVKLDSPGPAFFMQRRRGFNGRPFRIYKFRTMVTLDDGATVRQATRDDVRVTRIGRWLRRTSLDELPQIVNVLRGEMSLVGPRPHALAHDDEYETKISRYAYRHHVKPGITGWAQINGARGETASTRSMARRVDFDLWYISNWNLLLDMWILIRTTRVFVGNKDAY